MIHGLKLKKQKAREMIKNELRKPREKQNQNKIKKIEVGMRNLSKKINKLRAEKKKGVKK